MYKIFFVLYTYLLASASLSFAEPLAFLTHSVQGKYFIDANGEMRGVPHGDRRSFTIEVVRSMMEINAYFPKDFTELPLKRALRIVENEPNFALFNLARRPHREAKFKWVGPLQKDTIYFYQTKKSSLKLITVDDARKVRSVCVLNGNTQDTLLTQKGFTNIYRNVSYEGCFSMLISERVDFAVIAESSLQETLKKAEIDPDSIEPAQLLYFEQGYIAFSKTTPDEIIAKWQKAFNTLKANGKYQQLVKMYLLP
jgi:polar amino acid transport system substrate-binding protein